MTGPLVSEIRFSPKQIHTFTIDQLRAAYLEYIGACGKCRAPLDASRLTAYDLYNFFDLDRRLHYANRNLNEWIERLGLQSVCPACVEGAPHGDQ